MRVLKFVLVVALSFPVAAFFAGDVDVGLGEGVPFQDHAVYSSFVVAWMIVAFWASRASSAGESATRTCYAFAAAAFLLPVAAVVSAIVQPTDYTRLTVVLSLVFGGILGLLGLGAARFVKWLAGQDR